MIFDILLKFIFVFMIKKYMTKILSNQFLIKFKIEFR